jgi:hypothetical protein
MKYSVQLSQRSIDILGNLARPKQADIKKKRTKDTVHEVRTNFDELQKYLEISIWQLRRSLQKELYGLVGVFFGNFEGHHSHIFHPNYLSRENTEYRLMSEIEARGNEAMFNSKGQIVEAVTKIKSRHYGLYIPEQIRRNVERAIDNPEKIFCGDIRKESLPILEFMLARSLDLRKKHGENWYPYFSDHSISKQTGIEENKVEAATRDLTGVVCESYKMICCRPWRKRLFMPSSRFDVARQLLGSA